MRQDRRAREVSGVGGPLKERCRAVAPRRAADRIQALHRNARVPRAHGLRRALSGFLALQRHAHPDPEARSAARDLLQRFERRPRYGARPLLILVPFGPVGLVYDLMDTEGRPLPEIAAAFRARGRITRERVAGFETILRRSNIDVVWFTSEMFYEDRPHPRLGLERQRVISTGPLSGTGLRFLPVPHEGNKVAARGSRGGGLARAVDPGFRSDMDRP